MSQENLVRHALLQELFFKEAQAEIMLAATENALMLAEDSGDEKALDCEAQRLAGYLTNLDEVLRLLEAR